MDSFSPPEGSVFSVQSGYPVFAKLHEAPRNSQDSSRSSSDLQLVPDAMDDSDNKGMLLQDQVPQLAPSSVHMPALPSEPNTCSSSPTSSDEGNKLSGASAATSAHLDVGQTTLLQNHSTFKKDAGGAGLEPFVPSRESCLARYREKKLRRAYSHTVRYHMRKINADRRPRIKGRFVKASELADYMRSQQGQ
ncbi:hypothetical protein WJX72_006996 [[Myrmecia] bisecta]|uniref:CCT domain-containing protein n=1 Tax=[Myrmecia] bisecta TaxID=41462 RepID=A0AAW1Q5G2_9CHLO